MFSTFPDEWPGAGVLLLRATTGVGFIAQGMAYFGAEHEMGAMIMGIAGLMIAVGALLLIGSLSRWAAIAAAMTSLLGMFSWFPGPHVGLFTTPMTAVLALVIALALVCLGPGAFSLDAHLFGRREVIIPKNSSDNQN
jgi:uncharacterized membrane protein YphA (DoxX/SURF4 family)